MTNSTMNNSKVPLLNVQNKKTIDTGTGGLSISIHPDGWIHSINTIHPVHGYVTLSPVNQFSNELWFNSESVRNYRKELAETAAGFGIYPKIDGINKEVYLKGNKPNFLLQLDMCTIESTYYPVKHEKSHFLIQEMAIQNDGDDHMKVPIDIGGVFNLSRSSYGQLTEGGPIKLPAPNNHMRIEGNRITVINKNLPTKAQMDLYCDGRPVQLDEFEQQSESPIQHHFLHEIEVGANESLKLIAIWSLVPSLAENNLTLSFDLINDIIKSEKESSARPISISDKIGLPYASFIINRNLQYVASCCSMDIGDHSVCMITDHQLLPLSWNRDSYYMANLLMQAATVSDREENINEWKRIIKGHLKWMFLKAERPSGYWGRAYLTNGHCKDEVFQLDQQCYPFLELCNYVKTFNDFEGIKSSLSLFDDVLNMIMEYKDDDKWLFSTGETPADDKVDYPYHFSSQVLLWHTLKELAWLNRQLPFSNHRLDEWADNIKKDCVEAFSTVRNGNPIFAYLTDLKGNFQFYHDANDLPTVLAPIWGFCKRHDPIWKNTMEFAFSSENKGGHYEGVFAGLGSVHTPHPWPLGDGQELLYCKLTGQKERFQKTWEKLIEVVQWDGMFSEAVDENSGTVESRHWFSWPGAFISSVLLTITNDFD